MLRVVQRLLRFPLAAKLVGAQVIVLALCTGLVIALGWRPNDRTELSILTIAAITGLPATLWLVALALQPLRLLENTARRVWEGDFTARVPYAPLADRSMTSLAVTFNALVERLAKDRLHMREFASDVIRTGDEERCRAALALHESAAQSIAAVAWQLSALARDVSDTELSQRILFVKRQADDVLEDVRHLAERLHPRVLDDLGLAAALAQLARQAELESGVRVIPNLDRELSKAIDGSTAAAVYRMAQEATWNAVRHSSARTVRIRLFQRDTAIVVEVVDDGQGFDVHLAERNRRRGHGIFSMRDRLGLVDVEMQVESTLGAGTKVCAYIPKRTEEVEKSA